MAMQPQKNLLADIFGIRPVTEHAKRGAQHLRLTPAEGFIESIVDGARKSEHNCGCLHAPVYETEDTGEALSLKCGGQVRESNVEPFFAASTADSLKQSIENAAAPVAETISSSGDLPISESVQRAFRAAEESAGFRVYPLHILLGLASEAGSPVSNLLQSHGASVDELRSAIRQLQRDR